MGVSVLVAELEGRREGRRIGAGKRSHPGEDVMGSGGRLFVKRDERVTKEYESAGSRFCGSGAEVLLVLMRKEKVLAQFQEQRAQVVFNLNAMEIEGHVDAGDNVGAKKDAMAALHVEKFDRKNVGGLTEFFRGKKKRRSFTLIMAPPVNSRGDASEFARSERAENAKKVQIGMARVEIAARGGAVENDGFNIVTSEFLHPVYELRELCFA
jgi:hypothetical protein